MPRLHVVTAACLLGLAAACMGLPPEERADWQWLEEEGRIATKARVDEATARSEHYTWSDGIVILHAAYAPHPLGRGLRLTTHLQSPHPDSRTEFLLDTGSTSSWLSWGSPLAYDVHASPERTFKNAYGKQSSGHWGYLPTV